MSKFIRYVIENKENIGKYAKRLISIFIVSIITLGLIIPGGGGDGNGEGGGFVSPTWPEGFVPTLGFDYESATLNPSGGLLQLILVLSIGITIMTIVSFVVRRFKRDREVVSTKLLGVDDDENK